MRQVMGLLHCLLADTPVLHERRAMYEEIAALACVHRQHLLGEGGLRCVELHGLKPTLAELFDNRRPKIEPIVPVSAHMHAMSNQGQT